MKEIDVTRITYDSNTFDVIVCSHVLEHVLMMTKQCESYIVLKPNGWGIIQSTDVMNVDFYYRE